MNKINKYKNSVFIITLGITTILMLVGYSMGKSADAEFRENEYLFDTSVQLIWEEPRKSYEVLKKLYLEMPDTPLVVWQYGLANSSIENFDKALDYFVYAQDLNPVLTKNPQFLIEFGWVLMQNNELETAKLYLNKSLEYELNEDLNIYVANLLQEINTKLPSDKG